MRGPDNIHNQHWYLNYMGYQLDRKTCSASWVFSVVGFFCEWSASCKGQCIAFMFKME